MNFEKLIESGYMERFVTDILYTDLDVDCKDFLQMLYRTRKISLCEIGDRRASKISSEAENAAYENMIGIIVEEICHKGNKGLYEVFIDYYLERFLFIKMRFEDSANDVNKWLQLYLEDQEYIYQYVGKHEYKYGYMPGYQYECNPEYAFICRTFILLYCMTYGESEAVDKFMGMIDINCHYKSRDFRFYDKKKTDVDYYQMLEEYTHTSNIRFCKKFTNYVWMQKMFLAKHLGISPLDLADSMMEYMTKKIPASLLDFNDYHGNRDYPAMLMLEGLNKICRNHNMRQLVSFNIRERKNKGKLFGDLFEQMCIEKLYMTCIDSKTRGDSLDLDGLCERGHDNIDVFARELMFRFWFECYLIGQGGMQKEYYENFCPMASGVSKERLYNENIRLKEELSQCRDEIKKYEVAEKRRKKRQEAKKKSMKENKKIVSLDEKQEEEKKA